MSLEAKREYAQSAAISGDIMSLYGWAKETERQFEKQFGPLKLEDVELEDIRSFYFSFIGTLRMYQRYVWKPLRDLLETSKQQEEDLERVEKRLRNIRDKARKLFQDRLELKRLDDKFTVEEQVAFNNLAQDHEPQAAGIEETSLTRVVDELAELRRRKAV
jgi:hypothetical protein